MPIQLDRSDEADPRERMPGVAELAVSQPQVAVDAAPPDDPECDSMAFSQLASVGVKTSSMPRRRHIRQRSRGRTRSRAGTPVFAGTRVPVSILFDHLEEGESLESFLREHPSVTREQALEVLEAAKARVTLEA